MTRDQYGKWSIFLPKQENHVIQHGSTVKISMINKTTGERIERIPAWIKRAVRDGNDPVYTGVFWNPEPYMWKNPKPKVSKGL